MSAARASHRTRTIAIHPVPGAAVALVTFPTAAAPTVTRIPGESSRSAPT